ncbi:MAG: sensor domain-containing diguanylate cyclase [Treponema sp.]|nr:sensor domain-containing diguanylate cyclase [Treponema sp.]
MGLNSSEKKFKDLSAIAVISLLISVAFCSFLIGVTILNKTQVDKLRMEQQIFERAHRIYEEITRLMYKTEMLSALVIQKNGSTESFYDIAPAMIDDPIIQDVLLAPDGIVTNIYPYYGNEEIIGMNLFDNHGNREAMLAKELGELVLCGPFDLIDGGQALVGRLPVYIKTPEEDNKFWGFVSVTLKFPQVLEHAELEIFDTYGYLYELWRMNPDTDEKYIIASNYGNQKPEKRYIEKQIQILNAEWYLRVFPVRAWYSYPENIALVLAGFCISFLVFFVMQNNYQMKKMQTVFELMAITDPLTGIFNRRHFLDIVRINLEKARRIREDCYFIMFDIDRFKLVNDTYGHQIGDKVLVDVSTRIKAGIRPYDLFARYGGEEFIVFVTGINKQEILEMTERLRLSLFSRKFDYEKISITCTASFGISQFYDYNIDKALEQSDEALYAAKRNGRNCVIFYGENNV